MLIGMRNNFHKHSEANDGSQGGGGGGGQTGAGDGSFLAASKGGGGTQTDSANAGSSQGAGEQQSGGNAGASGATGGNGSTDWRHQLPKELQEDATIKKFTSLDALAKSYLNAQKLIGADKIPVPTKNATEDDWKNVWQKLGLPESPDKYEVKFKDGISLDEDFAKQFKEISFKSGILPQQAQKLAEWFSDLNIQSEQMVAEEKTKQFQQAQANLQKEWGQGFQLKVARAVKVIEDHGGAEFVKHFNEIGVGGDEKFIRFLANLGDKLYTEHKIVNESGQITSGKTPKEIQGEIQKLQRDPAYFDKGHPSHKAVVQEVQDLYQQLYPSKK